MDPPWRNWRVSLEESSSSDSVSGRSFDFNEQPSDSNVDNNRTSDTNRMSYDVFNGGGSRTIHRNRQDTLNDDLMWSALEDGSDEFRLSITNIPMMTNLSLDGMQEDYVDNMIPYYAIEVQSLATNPYYLLETAGCAISSLLLYSNLFMFAILAHRYPDNDSDVFLRYVSIKLINFSSIGFIVYIFTNPDTFKSVSITSKDLMINAILYEYKFNMILKYLAIHIIVNILIAVATIGIYYHIIDDIPTQSILTNIFASSRSYTFNVSYILVAIILHSACGIGLAVITNMTTSINARSKVIDKFFLLFLLSVTFGTVVGPIGYVWPSLVLYCCIILIRGDFHLFDYNLFITYLSTILVIVCLYPLIALQIKFVWRKKYIQYIEYYRRS